MSLHPADYLVDYRSGTQAHSKSKILVRFAKVYPTAVNFLIEVGEDAKDNLFYDIDTPKDGLSRAKRLLPNPSLSDDYINIITNSAEISTPRM